MRITKEMVLKGPRFREHVPVPELGEDAELVIRPLTDGEFAEIQQIIMADIPFAGADSLDKAELKITEVVEREKKAKYTALAFALSVDGESWTPEDVGNLPPGVPDRLYKRLSEISGFPFEAPQKRERKKRKKTKRSNSS